MELSADVQSWVNLILVWIGFGTVVGFTANLFLPAGKPPAFFANLVIGITGSCVGPVAFVLFLKPQHFHPMSPIGFAIAILASIVLLIFYRFLLLLFSQKPEKKGQKLL
jgi:uncharacterized membrane protein YeaQ/YmgE (transglycosylase-associated protein family)